MQLDQLLGMYGGLAIRRRLAMRLAFTNQPEGKGYVVALNQLYQADGYDTKDKSALKLFTDILWLGDDSERTTILRDIRAAMTPGQRARINSPIAARQRVEQVLKARASERRRRKSSRARRSPCSSSGSPSKNANSQ